MHRVGFLLILGLWNVAGDLRAESQKTALPDAAVVDSTEGNVRRIVAIFGARRLIAEQLVDNTAVAPMQVDFGHGPVVAPPVGKRLTEPTWLVDGAGDGFYLPIQPDFEVMTAEPPAAFHLQEVGTVAGQDRKWLRVDFPQTTTEEMAKIANLMVNPVLAPLQITGHDDAGIIVYDLASQTTGYAITKSSERMNSEGYLSGSSQPCVVLIRVNGSEMTLSAGKKGDAGTVRLKLFGDWKAASGETALKSCVQKAGRTWVEFNTDSDGSAPIHLVKLPEKSYLQRIFDIFGKKSE